MEIDGVPESSITFLSNIKENIAHYKPIGAEGLLLNALSRAESIRLRGKILSWAKIHEDIYAFALQAKFFFFQLALLPYGFPNRRCPPGDRIGKVSHSRRSEKGRSTSVCKPRCSPGERRKAQTSIFFA
jgi:hypothetical protein